MHCPKCGQQQITEETRFCSRCGFLLTGVSQLVANDGQMPSVSGQGDSGKLSPRRRGVRKGLFFFLLSFLILPIIMMITIASNSKPYVLIVAAIIFIVGGLLRAAYALMFEPGDTMPFANAPNIGHNQPQSLPANERASLPEGSTIPAAVYAAPPGTGMWRDTNELQEEPLSVTDSTTKLLERDQ